MSSFHWHPYVSFPQHHLVQPDVTTVLLGLWAFFILLVPSSTTCRSAVGILRDCSEMTLSARTVSSGFGIRLEGRWCIFRQRRVAGGRWMELVSGKSRVGRHYLENQKNFRLNTGRSCPNLVTRVSSMVQPWGTEDRYARRAEWFHPGHRFQSHRRGWFGVTVKMVEVVKGVQMRRWEMRRLRDWQKWHLRGPWVWHDLLHAGQEYKIPWLTDPGPSDHQLMVGYPSERLDSPQPPNPQPPHPQPDAGIHSVPLDGDLKNLNLCPL